MNKILFLLLFIFSSFSAYSNEVNLSTRPDPEGIATPVSVSIYVIDIEYIDNLRQNFTADFMVVTRWKDERLKGENKTMKLDDLWWPNTAVLNGRDLSSLMPKRAQISEDGSILYRQRYYGKMACRLDLKNFPFDEQVLPFSVITLGNSPEQIELSFLHDFSGSIEKFSNADWDIGTGSGFVDVFKAYSSNKSHKEFSLPITHFSFNAKRHVFYYIWKVIIPLMVIVMMSWAAFYFEPEQIAPQIGLAATSILTLIAFLFSLGKILPPIAYLTKIDYYVYSSLALVFLAFTEAVFTIKLSTKGNTLMAKKIDRYSRWIFPLIFLMILVLFVTI